MKTSTVPPARKYLFGPLICGPALEPLEGRLLLSSPSLATPLADAYTVGATGKATAIGIDGADPDGDPLTITANSSDPNLLAVVTSDTQYALMHFVDANGAAIGDVLVQLFTTESAAAANRIITLATTGYDSGGNPDPSADPFYTNVVVYRTIPNFMIQTGDAANGDGTGGSPLGALTDQFDPALSFQGVGVLAMANAGPNTSDGQFFITTNPYTGGNGSYMIFGQVISGMDIVNTLINLPRNGSDRPYFAPQLKGVDIVTSPQDGVVLLIPQEGFSGNAQVTITLDDGTGNTYDQIINVASDPGIFQPQIYVSQTQYNLPTGGPIDFTASISDPSALVAVQSDVPSVTATIDPTTHHVHIDVPVGLGRAAKITLTAWMPGSELFGNLPASEQTLYVSDVPELSQANLVTIRPGTNTPSLITGVPATPYVFTKNVSLSTATVAIDPATLQVTITTPTTYTGIFQVMVTLTVSDLAEPGYVPGYVNSPTTSYYAVSAQNAGDPAVLNWFLVDQQESNFAAVRDGNILYLAGGSAGLEIVDVTNPLNPIPLGAYNTPGTTRDVAIYHRMIISDVDHLPHDHTIALIADTTALIAVDVTDPANPVKLAEINASDLDPGATAAIPDRYFVNIAMSGNLAYVAEYNAGLGVYDTSDPAHLTLVSRVNTLAKPIPVLVGGKLAGYQSKLTEAVSVEVNGNTVYVGDAIGGDGTSAHPDQDGFAGVVVLNVTNPAAVQAVAGLNTTGTVFKNWGSPWRMDLVGGKLYVADEVNGLLVYDLKKPTAPKLVGTFADPGGVATVAVMNQVAILGVGDGFKFVNLANLSNISLTCAYAGPVAKDTATNTYPISGGVASVAGDLVILPFVGYGSVVMDAKLVRQLTVYKSTTFTATGGVAVTAKISGGGRMVLDLSGVGTGDIQAVTVLGSTTGTKATLSSATPVSIGAVHLLGPVGSFTATTGNLGGDFVADGSLGTLKLNNVFGHDIRLHDNPALPLNGVQASVTLNDVADANIAAHDVALKGLTVSRWLDTTGPLDMIAAAAISSLTVGNKKSGLPGDFQADLTLAGGLSKAKIAHNLSNAVWNVGSAGAITVTGAIDHTRINSAGNVTSVTTGQLLDSTIYAGVAATHDTLPAGSPDGVLDLFDPATDSFSYAATIGTVKIKGILGAPVSVSNSNIAAANLGTITLIGLQADNGTVPFGLASHTLKKFSYAGGAYKYSWPNKTVGHPLLDPVMFGDFTIRMF